MPKVSIIIPSHDSPQTAFFLARLFSSIAAQTFQDYEIILVREGLVGHNLNLGIRKAKGELIKIICQDDWFAHENSLKDIVDSFKEGWLIAGSHNHPTPFWTDKVPYGVNSLGGLSTITMTNKDPIFFEEEFKWMIDVEFYDRAFKKWGLPTIISGVNVNIGIHAGQTTELMSKEEKDLEINLTVKKYEESSFT